MVKYVLVEDKLNPPKSRWTIERVTPGERPVPLPFYGTRAEAEAEISRLSLHGEKKKEVPVATKHIPRPRDPIALAKLIGDIATGQVEDAVKDGKNENTIGRAGGLKGGIARAKNLTAQVRTKIARNAAMKRWNKD